MNNYKIVVNSKSQNWDFDYVGSAAELIFDKLKTSSRGLSEQEARKRLQEYGFNEPAKKKKRTIMREILSKFLNPLVIVLITIASFSLFFGEKISALIVSLMAVMSVMLAFIQEHRASKEAEKLSEMVRTTATVLRNGKSREVSIS
ncbi:MAG: cation-transporting P-type ATPase [Candidatus Omnitrophica bacterium]|nr:cation-transporting P-type ATPase [Candidatus Omnitrophota bacterium]